MKTTKHITSLMYFLVLLSLLFTTVFFILRISSKIFNKDEINSTLIKSNGKNIRVSGNLVPVNISLTIPDTITEYKNTLQ